MQNAAACQQTEMVLCRIAAEVVNVIRRPALCDSGVAETNFHSSDCDYQFVVKSQEMGRNVSETVRKMPGKLCSENVSFCFEGTEMEINEWK